eukprot:Opistho-2@95417
MAQISLGVAVLVASMLAGSAVAQLGCVGDDGKAVDWWIAVKFPKVSGADDVSAAKGVGYMYMDTANTNFRIPNKGLDDVTSAPGRTVQQVLDNPSRYAYAFYNDQLKESTSSYYAHAKGIVAYASTGGFWLVHSMPLFTDGPAKTKKYTVPSNGVIYGQSFICVSLNIANINIVGTQLQYYNPQVYDSRADATLAAAAPNMAAFLGGTRLSKTAGSSAAKITTRGGVTFASFAKNAKWGKDLYSGLVGPNLKTDLIIQSWMRPVEASYLKPSVAYEAINAITYREPTTGYTWTETRDHSKWAISLSPSKGIVCIGDINKQKSQFSRGGGTLCVTSCAVYNQFRALIATTDKPTTAPSPSDKCVIASKDEVVIMDEQADSVVAGTDTDPGNNAHTDRAPILSMILCAIIAAALSIVY